MKRALKLVTFAYPAVPLLIASNISWHAFSAHPVENLPLTSDLIAVSATEGRQLLLASPDKTDFGQFEPILLPQSRRGYCGPATSAALINTALRPKTKVTKSSLFNAALYLAVYGGRSTETPGGL